MEYTKTIWEDLPSEDTPITSANLQKIEDALAGMLDYFYPVGTIYETTSTNLDTTTKMSNHFGGTWEVYGAGRVLVAKSTDTEFDTIGETGGAKTHTLTEKELPQWMWSAYNQSGSGAVNTYFTAGAGFTIGSGGTDKNNPHNNLQPYIVVYRYRRTA